MAVSRIQRWHCLFSALTLLPPARAGHSPDFTNALQKLLLETMSVEATNAKEASTQLKKVMSDMQSLPALFEIGVGGEGDELRTLALTLLRKQVLVKGSKQWKSQPEELRSALKARLLQVVISEPSERLRTPFARLISSLGHVELPLFTWPELRPWLHSLATSSSATQKEVSLQVIYYLVDTLVVTPAKKEDGMANNVWHVLALVGRTVRDVESLVVRVWSVRVLGKLSEFVEAGEGWEAAQYQELVPSIIAVLDATLKANHRELARHCFDVVEGLTLSESPLLTPHLGSVLELLLTSAAITAYDDALRVSCLHSVLWIVKFKKGKVQSLNLAHGIVTARLPVIAESTSATSTEESTPSRSALTVLEALATSLPPSQVLPALFQQLGALATSPDAGLRKAGIAALGVVVEGCAAALHEHMASLWPFLEAMLKDSEVSVRKAALVTLGALCEWLGDDCGKQHAMLMPLLSHLLADAETQPAACVALDSLLESLNQSSIEPYLPTLMDALLSLLDSSALDFKGMVVGAIGSAAYAAKSAFAPYFPATMERLLPFLSLTEEGDALELRTVAQDTVSTLARAVGAEVFRPHMEQTMQIALEALRMEGCPVTLRECSMSCFAALAGVFGEEFARFLPEVMPALLEAVQRDEDSAMLGSHTIDLSSAEDVEDDGDFQDQDDSDFSDVDSDDSDDLDDANEGLFEASAAIASQKECAIDALGDLFAEIKIGHFPYVEASTAALLANLKPHWHPGIRRASVCALLGFVATAHSIVGGPKWEKGDVATPLNSDVASIANAVLPPILALWKNEEEKEVVDELCSSLSDALLVVGPALVFPAYLEDICKRLEEILGRDAPCQINDADEDEDEDDEEAAEQSEADSALMATACDLVGTLATVLGAQFASAVETFMPLMLTQAAAGRPSDLRASAIGSLAEVCLGLESSITPFTSTLLTPLLQALHEASTAADWDVKTNAAFALGALIEQSGEDLTERFGAVLSGLRPLFEHVEEEAQGARDNACGAVARMIGRNAGAMPLEQVLPVLLAALPLKRDFAENKPVMSALMQLIRIEHPLALQHLDAILVVFHSALTSVAQVGGVYPEVEGAQVDGETREKIVELVRELMGSSEGERVQRAGLTAFV